MVGGRLQFCLPERERETMKRVIGLLLATLLLTPAVLAGAESNPALSFSELQRLNWYFSSGVGGWGTEMTIYEDGSFTGDFHDSEMGEMDEEAYPYGTIYGCLFHGKLAVERQIDEYTWALRVEALALDEGQAPEAIEDGIRYVTSDPYGLVEGHEMLLYLPGTPVERLPEEFLMWAHYYEEAFTALPFYGLYDPINETGFTGEEPVVFPGEGTEIPAV